MRETFRGGRGQEPCGASAERSSLLPAWDCSASGSLAGRLVDDDSAERSGAATDRAP